MPQSTTYTFSKGVASGARAAETATRYLQGATGVLAEHEREIRNDFADQLLVRYQHYAAETRWPDSPFWRVRQQAPAPLRGWA